MNSKINSKKLKISPEIAEICGIHVGDGYLRNDGKRRELDISGSYDEKEYYDNHMIPLFNKVFNLNLKGRFFPHRNTYGFVIRDVKVIEFMHEKLGFPYGGKSLKVQVPKFISKDNLLIKSFLRGYFDTDGYFGCKKRYKKDYTEFKRKYHYYPRISVTTVSSILSESIRDLLDILKIKFCFHTHQPDEKTKSLKYIYEINGPERVNKFMNLTKPGNLIKKSRFIIWKKFGFCPTNITYKQRKDILNGKLNPHIFYRGPIA